jgi:nitrogen fixation protein FixH
VRDDYYIEELQHQQKIDKENRANDLSAPVTVTSSADGAVIALPKEFHQKQVSGSVYFYRPSDAQLDRHITLQTDTAGKQIIRTELATGQYNVQVEWTAGGQTYFSETPLYVQR